MIAEIRTGVAELQLPPFTATSTFISNLPARRKIVERTRAPGLARAEPRDLAELERRLLDLGRLQWILHELCH
jgi:hypothetical protein